MSRNIKPNPVPTPLWVMCRLSPQEARILEYMRRTGSITQRDAMLDLGVQSLTRRITSLRVFYEIEADRRTHKGTGQNYTRYFLKSLRKDAAEQAAKLGKGKPLAPLKGLHQGVVILDDVEEADAVEAA